MGNTAAGSASDGPFETRNIASHVGDRIAALRGERKLNRRRLARQAEIAYSYLVRLEEGRHEPTLGIMLRLVRAFDLCSIEELLGGPLGTRTLLDLMAREETEGGVQELET